jgi:hypothetical protein
VKTIDPSEDEEILPVLQSTLKDSDGAMDGWPDELCADGDVIDVCN